MPSIAVNGTDIYHEVRGRGSPLFFIHGALADASQFQRVADLLADEFTVVTYDRRGHSRSPRPAGWMATGPDEQADDAAALLAALALAPAAVYGNSSGAIMALNLVIRYPEVVRGAILHEPPLFAGFDRPEAVRAELGATVEKGMAAGGPPAAAETFLRWAAGDANWEGLTPDQQERVRGNGETFFGLEIGNFEPYRPPDSTLASVSVPVQVMVSDGSAPFFEEAAAWLATRLGVQIVRTPGTHTPQFDHPSELARNIRSFLKTRTAGRSIRGKSN